MMSAALMTQIAGTLDVVFQGLHSAPELQLVARSAQLSFDKLRRRVVTYEELLPRLRSVVARQRDQLGNSAALLEEARQAHLELQFQHKLQLTTMPTKTMLKIWTPPTLTMLTREC